MELLHQFATSDIIPHIYQLNNGDSLIIHEEDKKIYLILEGTMLLQKLFTNKEVITTHIVNDSNLIDIQFNNSYKKNYCYKVEAISTTYISSFSATSKNKIISILLNYNQHYKSYNYYSTAEILIHKNSKNRLIHLLLLLSELSGKDQHNMSVIDLNISHINLASIIGSNTNTISKIIKSLEKLHLINYQKNKITIYSLSLLSAHRYR